MARIAGVDLPREKRIEIGLTYIYGIGRVSATKILEKAGVNPDTRVRDLTDEEVARIRDVIDETVTLFWNAYYDYHAANAPHLPLHVNRGKKGPNATWPDFRTILTGAKILHKSEQGCVDLQFRGAADRIKQLEKALNGILTSNMLVCKVGNSAAVRIRVPVMDFSKEFTSYQKEIAEVFSAINQLNDLAIKIHMDQLWHP